MKISICIPNYNYERYLGKTLRSVLDQSGVDLEVLVSDNASTDGSVEVVRRVNDPRVHVHVNACNVGFAANIDRAVRMASGDVVLVLSSDDLLRDGALARYGALFDALGPAAKSCVVTASADIIDAHDARTGGLDPIASLWTPADRAPALDAVAGGPVYRVAGDELLRRCLSTMKNPFNFLATAYPLDVWRALEGYGGGRMINPDKWFHFRLLGKVGTAVYIDAPLFAYRWHAANQTAQQNATAALKYLVDEYATTLEVDERMLARAKLSRDDVVKAFVEHDIARHGLATLARGDVVKARRILDFGRAVYPRAVADNRKCFALELLSRADRIGVELARVGRKFVERGVVTA